MEGGRRHSNSSSFPDILAALHKCCTDFSNSRVDFNNSDLSVKTEKQINRIYTISCKIAGCWTPDTSLEQLYKSRTLQKATKILSNANHFTVESLCYAMLEAWKKDYAIVFSYAMLMVYYVFSHLSVVNQNRYIVDAFSSFA